MLHLFSKLLRKSRASEDWDVCRAIRWCIGLSTTRANTCTPCPIKSASLTCVKQSYDTLKTSQSCRSSIVVLNANSAFPMAAVSSITARYQPPHPSNAPAATSPQSAGPRRAQLPFRTAGVSPALLPFDAARRRADVCYKPLLLESEPRNGSRTILRFSTRSGASAHAT
jgi:hypothetical protein